jgi:ABC-type phosphate transport system substrate-binding protein
MRTTIGIATFCVVAAGALGVSANVALVGSDTIKDTTVSLLTNNAISCGGLQNAPAGTLSYLGTGSGNGEAAMDGKFQDVAPMSRRMGTVVCGTVPNTNSKAQGIVFALDGISIVANSATVGTCTGTSQQAADGSQCGSDPAPGNGLKFSGTLACGLTLTSWKDVLRLVYLGFEPGISGVTAANQNCLDACRTELLNNYGELFQQSCTIGAGCTQLMHAFRRNDESGTTDVFVSSLGGTPSISQQNNYNPFCNAATTGPAVSPVAVTCSAAAAANDGICSRDTGGTVGTCDTVNGKCTVVTCTTNADCVNCSNSGAAGSCNTTTHKCDMEHITTAQSLLPSRAATITAAAGHTVDSLTYWQIGGGSRLPAIYGPPTVPISGAPIDMQDADPARRTCLFQNHVGTESVCGVDGTLGVVLPIWDATETSQGIGQADAFPATACTQGVFGCAPAFRIAFDPGSHTTVFALCPDGTDPNVAGSSVCPKSNCVTPQTGPVATPNFACLNTRGNVGSTQAVDGRVYNLTVWKNNVVGGYPRSTGQCAATPANTTNLTGMYRGAYFRLHQQFVATGSTGSTCQAVSATDQISCLVQASPCSIGYAGNSAVVGNTVAVNVNNIAPSNACIQQLLLAQHPVYPIARKLYFNAVNGFDTLATGTSPSNVSAADQMNEHQLARCFGRMTGFAGSAEDVAVGLGFIPLPTSTVPFCDDVASDLCGSTNGCSMNAANTGIPILGFPNPAPGNAQNVVP